jgi:two-component system phosphate regulon sensor histidine kinase PhoR
MTIRNALGGALLASLAILGAALARDGLDPVLALAAVAAILAAAWLSRPPRRPPGAPPVAVSMERLARVDALFATIPDALVLVDRRTVVLEANDAARRLLPALREGLPLSFALRAPAVLEALARVIQSGEAQSVEYSERVPVERSFQVRLARLADLEGSPPASEGVVLVFYDLTAIRRVERQRADFVANASHELRTPLAALLGFVETLQGSAREDPAARDRFLEVMRAQALRMRRLIDDLLSLSRIEMAVHQPPSTQIELAPLLRQAVDALGGLAQERGVEIDVEAQDGLLVVADRDELLRLAENLIENAIKYGGEGGRVDIRAAREEGGMALTVRDYGAGIAPEHLPRLTERFYRVDAGASREKGGTGLGLAIVKHIVTRHRGRLAIESEPGRGATFRVTLPMPTPA